MDQSNNRYTIEGNQLKIGDSVLEFKFPIVQSLEISGMLILRLEVPIKTIYNENVFGVSMVEKKIKWQIDKRRYSNENCPFTYISLFNDELTLINWCSIYFTVSPLTGAILKEGFSK